MSQPVPAFQIVSYTPAHRQAFRTLNHECLKDPPKNFKHSQQVLTDSTNSEIRDRLVNRSLDCCSNRDEWNLGMDMDISTVADSPRDPALMRMQMEVPSSRESHNKWVCRRHGTSFAKALKTYRNHRITFPGRPIWVMSAISLYARVLTAHNSGRVSITVLAVSLG